MSALSQPSHCKWACAEQSLASAMDRVRSQRVGILDRGIARQRSEVSASAFAFLFSEMVQYSQNRVTSIPDLERKLEEMGYGVGIRVLEVVTLRDKYTRRETRIVSMLQYIQNNIWKALFGKAADSLERSMENEDEYMIHDTAPVTNTFISVPSDLGQLNCAAYIAGIIAGVLDSAKFDARVNAHTVNMGDGADKTVYLIKFASTVMERERRLGAA